jgi:DNA topoisomerase-1
MAVSGYEVTISFMTPRNVTLPVTAEQNYRPLMNLQLLVRDIAPEEVFEPRAAARLAELVYVSDESPGITRRKSGSGFAYYDTKGRLIRDPEVLKRIRSLAVPPAYRNVWICPDPNGHIQATGRDDKGREQYRYHPRWSEVRDSTKYEHMLEFAKVLPAIRARVSSDMAKRRKGARRSSICSRRL